MLEKHSSSSVNEQLSQHDNQKSISQNFSETWEDNNHCLKNDSIKSVSSTNSRKNGALGNFSRTIKRQGFSKISFRGEAGPLLHRYRHTRFSSRRIRKRVVFKHGDCNVVQGNVAKRRRRYLQDIFTTLVDAQWRWTLLVFAMTFLLSWLGFALVWWLIVYAHGDLDPLTVSKENETFTPCVEDIHGFTSCFLFSVETQHTIGYGSKHTTEECPEAIFIMCIQSMTGVILQAFMVGIVFAKLSRPKKRTQTLLFSRNAVICQRDGEPCLMFRVGDMRKSHIIEAHVRAQMIKRKVTREGELLPFNQTELKVGADGEEDKILFIWPTTIVHKIDHSSPLYNLSASDMLRERFEIVVVLEGVIESTGMTTQARSSYLPTEILWGHRFENIITFRKETGEYEVNYTLFNNTYEVDTPLCSAAELDRIKALQRVKGEKTSSGTFAGYKDDSSSSYTSGSGSSFASSAGGLHIFQIGTPPLSPIPVMITGPDEFSRRESTDDNVPRFFSETMQEGKHTQEEVGFLPIHRQATEIYKDENQEEDYDKVLESINATLRQKRRDSMHGKESKKLTRHESKSTLNSGKTDSRINIDITDQNYKIQDSYQPHGTMKKSPSHPAIELRKLKQPPPLQLLTRRSSLTESHKHKHHHDLHNKKTSFHIDNKHSLSHDAVVNIGFAKSIQFDKNKFSKTKECV